jgi:heme exporter protein D
VLLEFESRTEKMIVVHQRIFNAGRAQRRRELRLPNAFGKPGAARACAQMLFDVIREPRDLLQAVFRRNHRQDRLVKSSAGDFHLPALHQSAQLLEIFRMRPLDPFEQRTRIMQPDANRRMARQNFHERKIRLLVGALQHVVKISHRLMRVN